MSQVLGVFFLLKNFCKVKIYLYFVWLVCILSSVFQRKGFIHIYKMFTY